MEVELEGPDSDGKRKRKRSENKSRFRVRDQVEVKSEEDGFQGSWHPGKVLACKQGVLHVRYNNFLVKVGRGRGRTRKLTEKFEVPDFVDGSGDCNYSRLIRFVPPRLEFEEGALSYGLCVDVWHNDIWWEGVVFDRANGSKRRGIFFPDLGDEMNVGINAMRITQDWDEVTKTWQRRGTWVFLQLIEENELSGSLPVSVKQIWYDVRLKEGFQKIGEWTSTNKGLWKELITEVIDEHLAILFRFIMEPISETAKGALAIDVNTNSEADAGCHTPVAPVISNNAKMEPGKWYPVKVDIVPGAKACPEAVSGFVMEPISETAKCALATDVNTNSEADPGCHAPVAPLIRRNAKMELGKWYPVTPDLVPRAKACPEAVSGCASFTRNKKILNACKIDARMHLLYLGWKIDHMRDKARRNKLMTRFRYTSPDGECYYSLVQACLAVNNSPLECEVPSSITQDDPRNLIASLDNQLSFPLAEQFQEAEDPTYCLEDDSKSLMASPENQLSFPLDEQFQETEDPAYCPEAVEDYYHAYASHRGSKEMKQKVKNHLLAMGWDFRLVKRIGVTGKLRNIMSYYSPSGKCVYSLRQACGRWLDEEGIIGSSCQSQDDLRPEVQLSSLRELRTRKVSGASIEVGDDPDGNYPALVGRSRKRVRQVLHPSSFHHIPRTILSWLIDNSVVLPRVKVYYRSRKDLLQLAEGRITRNGIKCRCCQEVFTPSNFEIHAGNGSTYHCASANIFLKDGRSLLDCQKQVIDTLSLTRVRSGRAKGTRHQGENDDICTVCHYGGDLVLCDNCPSSFHTSCLGLKDVPDGDWFCPSCCCGICCQHTSKVDTAHRDDDLVTCCQCEQKYHPGCTTQNTVYSERNAKDNWFCSNKCGKIFNGLHELTGKSVPVGENLTWTLLKPNQLDDGAPDACVEASTQIYCRLSVALGVMHDCFEPVKEPYTKRDLVEDVLFNRECDLNRLNFRGFYTVVLERNDEIITVATMRVFGEKVAEVPLVGTTIQHRRKGMCRILMNELEKRLAEVGVERLILPAVPSVLNTWTTSFGFSQMGKSERLQFLGCTFLDFPDTVLCQKLLKNNTSPESSLSGGMSPKIHADVNGNYDSNDFDGSSAVSEVFQAEHMEESVTENPGLEEIKEAKGDTGNPTQVHLPVVPEKGNGFLKSYKRRRKSARLS